MQLVSLRLRYYSDKLKLNQIMHWLGAIGIVGTQILLRQTRVDSDFTQIIWVKICWLRPLAVQLRQTFYECLIFYQNMILKKELRKQILHHIRWISDNISIIWCIWQESHFQSSCYWVSPAICLSACAPWLGTGSFFLLFLILLMTILPLKHNNSVFPSLKGILNVEFVLVYSLTGCRVSRVQRNSSVLILRGVEAIFGTFKLRTQLELRALRLSDWPLVVGRGR